ncbi:serine hydrolase [Ruminococcus sp.]|uniref:serine hydrolase domain-containing protein n=1 Tax=Ruminococcus sp. TaxID=41978 RepID=UPI0025EBF947|nr:serine hydrolase [Ruminococcus sp.]MBQ8967481.1 serine hydrolase [Ruminococcus sp.]
MYQRFFEMAENAGISLHCAEIFHKGQIAEKRCFAEDKAYPIYSAAKSVTAAAVLIARSEGRLDISDKLYRYMDSRYLDVISADFRELTFENCMTMCIGAYPFRPQNAAELLADSREDDWLYNIFRLPVDNTDRRFHYSNIPAYLVSAACENAVGQPLAEYLSPRLFVPLGWGRPVYQTSPEGHFYGATGMELTVSQLARLGQLFLQKGMYEGRQLIPEELALRAVTEKVRTDREGYGYFFWVGKNTFAISGKWGQRCAVCPEKELMVTYLSHNPERSGELAAIAQRFMDEF